MDNKIRLFLVAVLFASLAASARAWTIDAECRKAVAVSDSLPLALSYGDTTTLNRLTLDSSVVSGIGLRDGVERMSLRAWGHHIKRTSPSFMKRGFGATVLRLRDHVATVRMPYDLYIGNNWSHCGVDVFTLTKSEDRWRVASLIYTVEQPPACIKHPAGPPEQYRPT